MSSNTLRLRALEPEDADLLFDIENRDDARRYGVAVAPLSRQLLMEYALAYDADPVKAGQIRLMAVSSTDSQPVAIADLQEIDTINSRAFVGIYTLPQHRGKGFALEVLNLLADYARRLGLANLFAYVAEGNESSRALFLKAGYFVYGCLPQFFRIDGRLTDTFILGKSL